MGVYKTHEQFVSELYDLVGDEYLVNGTYAGRAIKIMVTHRVCGTKYLVAPGKILQGRRCPVCAGENRRIKNTKTAEAFLREVRTQVDDEYTVLGNYVNARTKIRLRHNSCGHEYSTTPSSFIDKKRRCPQCNNGIKYSHADFVKRVKAAVGDEYEVLGDYIDSNTVILMKHNRCGLEYRVRPANFLYGQRCPSCAVSDYGLTRRKTHSQFVGEVRALVGDEYAVTGKYVGSETKIKIRHETCGFEYEIKPNNFLNGRRCPKCGESRGEKKIFDYLTNKNIDFVRQYRISDCRGKKYPMAFDFAIPDKDIMIEYDGIQHFEPVAIFGGVRGYNETVKRDKIKSNYCVENGIKLVRVPYTVENLCEFLDSALFGVV